MTEALGPVVLPRQRSYREAVYRAIKEAILAGRLRHGHPLVEDELAADLNVSRTPVREALAILEHEGLIEPRGRKGFQVRRLSREEFVTMFVANEVVEPYLARKAALLATDEQLAAMRDAIELGERASSDDDIQGVLRSGRGFHRAMGKASGNASLTEYVARNEERTDLYLMSSDQVHGVSQLSPSVREHQAIYEAIRQHDPEAAARLVVYHSQSVRERLAPLFGHDEHDQPE